MSLLTWKDTRGRLADSGTRVREAAAVPGQRAQVAGQVRWPGAHRLLPRGHDAARSTHTHAASLDRGRRREACALGAGLGGGHTARRREQSARWWPQASVTRGRCAADQAEPRSCRPYAPIDGRRWPCGGSGRVTGAGTAGDHRKSAPLRQGTAPNALVCEAADVVEHEKGLRGAAAPSWSLLSCGR